MSDDLMSLPLRELLEKFAAGKHKPGSGSAAALLGLISASLSRTVIALTADRPEYAPVEAELQQIAREIKNELQPLLEEAFAQDSVLFDKVIESRKSRDKSVDHAQWWRRSHEALSKLDAASLIALNIARKSIRLAELAIVVFDEGFKSAQGDSEVAIEAALAGATGALSVVYLNLKDFRGEAHAKKTLDDAERIAVSALGLRSQLSDRMERLRARAVDKNSKLSLNAPKLLLKKKKHDKYSKEDLVHIARNIHSELWLNREKIWTDADRLLPVQMIDPATTFRLHGFGYEETVSLGQAVIEGESVEVAGYVDIKNKMAKVSQKFKLDVRRFTSAHELGHAILHNQETLFRDRALNGGAIGLVRPQIEIEADAFAAFFLMPEVQVRDIFAQIFGQEQFVVDKHSAFAIGFANLSEMQSKLPTLRHLTTRLATTDLYSGIPTRSLCEIFGVSPAAMAIRIEELSLVRFT